MSKKYKVIAVVVTYNRSETLQKNLQHLLSQSYELEKIIIVDNNSNETHRENLIRLGKQFENRIEIILLDENLGGAGGFEIGMKQAYKDNPDFYWIMDDDAYPSETCLEKLLKYAEKNSADVYIPMIIGTKKKKVQYYQHKIVTRIGMVDLPKFISNKAINGKKYRIISLDANGFVGPLIRSNCVNEVGFPDGKFFVYGDDLEYTYRIRKICKRGIRLVPDAVIYHEDVPTKLGHLLKKPTFWWKEYYMYRNKIVFIKRHCKSKLNKYFSFTILITTWLFDLIIPSLLFAITEIDKVSLLKIRFMLMKTALKDGFNERLGKTIDPKEYNLMINYLGKNGGKV